MNAAPARLSATSQAEEAVAELLKGAMRRLASSVAVLSACLGDRRFAMAATSVQSLSLAPPAILACVNRSASFHLPLSAGGDFAVNVLSSAHVEVADACGGGRVAEERFDVGDWRQADDGTPYLADAQITLFCRCDGHMPYGTHGIFVGRVIDVRVADQLSPLVYLDGRYCGIDLSTFL